MARASQDKEKWYEPVAGPGFGCGGLAGPLGPPLQGSGGFLQRKSFEN